MAEADAPTEQAVGDEIGGLYPRRMLAYGVEDAPFVDAPQVFPRVGRPFEVDAGNVEEQGEQRPG